MYRRTVFVPAVMAAAVLVACAVTSLAISEKAEAAFPGRSGKVAFSSRLATGEGVDNPEGDAEIFTVDPDGTNLVQVTRNTTDDRAPDWSADGKRIAYSGYDGSDHEIYTVTADGGATSRLTDNTEDDVSPTFSPNGTKIAYEGVAPINEEIPDWKVRRIYLFLPPGARPASRSNPPQTARTTVPTVPNGRPTAPRSRTHGLSRGERVSLGWGP